ncbi:MAG: hypothetical protein AB2L20_29685 [Mangrovibacterium sp.]
MRNRLVKLLGIAFIVSLLAFNIISSINPFKSETSLSSLLIAANANAEDWSTCYWSPYGGGDYGPFMFCGYEINNQTCTCGSFIPH